MRPSVIFLWFISFPILLVIAASLTNLSPRAEFATQLQEELNAEKAELAEQHRKLLLRVQLLEYQNYLMLGVISDAGMRLKLEVNNLSLFPPETEEGDLWNSERRFDRLYKAYLQQDLFDGQPARGNDLFYTKVKPPYVSHFQFKRDWKLVSTLQATHASKD